LTDVVGLYLNPPQQRQRHQEFLKFLRCLDQEFPGEIPLHLVMDNYGTHKHPRVQAWSRKTANSPSMEATKARAAGA
jgi:hypothetical protein